MKIRLYDNIHPTAGAWGRAPRPSIGDAARAPWVKAMYGRLETVSADGGRFAADLDVDVGLLRMRVVRHGTALSAVWSVGAQERPVAVSVLLAGAAAHDDESAVLAVRGRTPRLPFGEADYAALLAQQRPCLGTMYLDGRWYDNARVELPATALALAALQGPAGRLTVRGGEQPAPPTPHRVSSPFSTARPDGLKFNFTRARLEHVMGMVTRKGNAAMRRLPGVHFRVYPPREFLERPGVFKGRDLYDKLKDTAWWVRWYDGRCDRLEFGELLGFIDQLIEVERAFRDARGGVAPVEPEPQNLSAWGHDGTPPLGGRTPVRVGQTLDTRKIVTDESIRRAFAAIMLEPALMPDESRAAAALG